MQDKKKTAPVKPSEMKRTRRDRGELEDIMFKLFERQPNWALKQLVQETDQPAVCFFFFLPHFLSWCPLDVRFYGRQWKY